MKKFKNLLLLAIVSICSFMLAGVTVNATVGFSNQKPVCNPADASENLKPGDKTTCYIIGTASQVGGSVHGFMSRLYTTDGLIFDSVKPYVEGTKAQAYVASASSDQNTTVTLDDQTSVNFVCKYDTELKAETPDWQINTENGDEFRCAFFYSSTNTNAFTTTAARPTTDIQGFTGTDNGLMVVGIVEAHIDENAKEASRCGELCVYTKEADTVASYPNLNEGSSDSSGGNSYLCAEVHYTSESVATDTPTGAFVSYAILAAGALIAISAVAIAKKHNKIYKV